MNKLTKILTSAVLTALVVVTTATAQNTDWYTGNITKDTFYISTESELQGLAELVNHTKSPVNFNGKTIILNDNITLTKNHTPIGNNSTNVNRFLGIFDGNGHSISNLTASSGGNYTGLFGYIGDGNNGQIKNITVNVVRITGSIYAGGLAAYYFSEKPIENCGVNISDTILFYPTSSTCYVGGLIGYSYAKTTIKNSYVNGNIDAKNSNFSNAGGLVGYIRSNSFIYDSYSTGNVSASYCAGGLVGYAYNTNINNSYSTGDVSASYNSVSNEDFPISYSGGLVGIGGGNIINSYSTGNVSSFSSHASAESGGLVGAGGNNGKINISNSYSTSDVSASGPSPFDGSNMFSGGLIGMSGYPYTAILTNCYASGTITTSGIHPKNIGGIFGSYYSDVNSNTSVYYNSASASKASGDGEQPSGISGLSLAELKYETTFQGWDFENIWGIIENESTPFLLKQLSDGMIIPITTETYTSEAITPTITVKDGDKTLVLNNDYSVAYSENINVGTATVTITGMGTYNNKVTAFANFTILPKQLSVSDAIAQDKIYDGTTFVEIIGTTLEGIITDDDVEINNITGTFDDKNVGINKTVTSAITLSGVDAENYILIQPTLTANITPKELTTSCTIAKSKVYDGTTSIRITGAALVGAIEGDDVSLMNYASGNFENSNVEADKAVSVNIGLKGEDAGNYTLTQPTGLTASITPKPISEEMIAEIVEQIHTGNQITPSIVVSHNNITLVENIDYEVSYGTNINVGIGTVTITGIDNYSESATVNFNIIADGTPINKIKKSDNRYGIKFAQNIVSDKAEISVVLPNGERLNEVKIVVYDAIGNAVFTKNSRGNETTTWNLQNNAGRIVANGTYLVIAEAKSAKGIAYRYSAKLGVKK